MAFFILLLGLAAAVFAVFLAFVITGSVLRFVAGIVGVRGITLRNAMLTALLAGLAAAGATLPIALAGWQEPFSLWILGVVVQGVVIRWRFSTGLTAGIVIAFVVTIVWLFVGLILAGAGRALLQLSGH